MQMQISAGADWRAAYQLKSFVEYDCNLGKLEYDDVFFESSKLIQQANGGLNGRVDTVSVCL